MVSNSLDWILNCCTLSHSHMAVSTQPVLFKNRINGSLIRPDVHLRLESEGNALLSVRNTLPPIERRGRWLYDIQVAQRHGDLKSFPFLFFPHLFCAFSSDLSLNTCLYIKLIKSLILLSPLLLLLLPTVATATWICSSRDVVQWKLGFNKDREGSCTESR